jgi:hypothetical protein
MLKTKLTPAERIEQILTDHGLHVRAVRIAAPKLLVALPTKKEANRLTVLLKSLDCKEVELVRRSGLWMVEAILF